MELVAILTAIVVLGAAVLGAIQYQRWRNRPVSVGEVGGTSPYSAHLELIEGGWRLSVRKNSGSGYWTSLPQEWFVVGPGGKSVQGTWTYDFRSTDKIVVAEGPGYADYAQVNMDSGLPNLVDFSITDEDNDE